MESAGKTRLAAHGVCRAGDSVLLVRDRRDATWGVPGGGVEWSEAPEATVVREFEEETGLVVVIDRLLGIHTNTFPSTSTRPALHFIGVLYEVRVLGGKLTVEVDGSTDAAEWVNSSELSTVEVNDHALNALGLAGILVG